MSTKNCFIKSTITIIGLLCCFSIGQASINSGVSVTVAKPSITLNSLSFTESGAETFTAMLSNVSADYAAKGYRIEWGNKGIVTGMARSRNPYQVTGVLREGFRASDGDLTVRLLKDSIVVAETSLLSSPTPIIVSNKTICSGDADRTITAQVPSWEPGYWIRWTDDAWHVDPGLEITGNTTVRISDNYPVGEHMLWAFLFTGTGNLVGSTNFKLTILPGPLAEIEDLSGCVSPGAGFTLSARASDNCTYLWDYGSVSRNSEVGLTIDGVMGNEDLQYILKVTDKSNGCVSSDTSIVRSAPAVPQVAIDTNTNRLDIKIHWPSVNGATGYNVYSRKWDPYCLTSENGGTYTKTAVTSLAHTRSAANVANDTLAFFYVTATNGICESSPSDTVGYVRHCVDATNLATAVNYVFPYIFDMSRYLAGDKIQHLLYYFFNGNVIQRGVWNYERQGFDIMNYSGSLRKWMPFDPNSDLVLKVGDSYLIGAKNGEKAEFVQFGYLKDTRVSFTLRATEGEVSNTPVWLPLIMADKNTYNTMTESLQASTGFKLNAIAHWSLEFEIWDMVNAMPGFPGGPFFDNKSVKPGFESILFDANEMFIWP